MYANYWDRFLPALKRRERIWSTPYTWSCKEGRFILIRQLPYVKRFRVLSLLYALHLPLIYWNLLHTLRYETNIMLIVYSLGYTGLTSLITVVRWMYQNQDISGDIVKLLNATVDFEKLRTMPGIISCGLNEIYKVNSGVLINDVRLCYFSGPRTLAVRGVRLLMMTLDYSADIFTMGTVSIAILCPRIPPFFGYFLCQLSHDLQIFGDPCQIRSDLNIRNLVSFIILDITNIFRILSGCICLAIYTTGHHAGQIMTTYEVLPSLIFQKNCLSQFQAEITHAKFSDYKNTMEKYRQLQLLNIQFNETYSTSYFAIVMAGVIMIMVPSGYLLVTSYHINHIVLIALVFITITQYLIITTIFIMASKVWNGSVKFRDAWRKNLRLSSRPLSRRYGTSLQNLKIKIGSFNFVERNTPFVFVSFCIEQTIMLVLLNNF
jgi:hypothetical protein